VVPVLLEDVMVSLSLLCVCVPGREVEGVVFFGGWWSFLLEEAAFSLFSFP
jgi:hypothetical protein